MVVKESQSCLNKTAEILSTVPTCDEKSIVSSPQCKGTLTAVTKDKLKEPNASRMKTETCDTLPQNDLPSTLNDTKPIEGEDTAPKPLTPYQKWRREIRQKFENENREIGITRTLSSLQMEYKKQSTSVYENYSNEPNSQQKKTIEYYNTPEKDLLYLPTSNQGIDVQNNFPVPEARAPISQTSHIQPSAKDVYLNVKITYSLSESEYYVVKSKDSHIIEEINRVLGESPKRLLHSPNQNKIYSSKYDGFGCRVRVIAFEPLTVRYIDFGNEEVIQNNNLFLVPPRFTEIKPLAFKIKLVPSPTRTLEEEREILIKQKDDDVWELVETEPTTLKTISSESDPTKMISATVQNDIDDLADINKEIEREQWSTMAVQENNRSSIDLADDPRPLINVEENDLQTSMLKSILFAAPQRKVENVKGTTDQHSPTIKYSPSCLPVKVQKDTCARATEMETESSREEVEVERDSALHLVTSDSSKICTIVHEAGSEPNVVVHERNIVDTRYETSSSELLEKGKTSIITVVGDGYSDQIQGQLYKAIFSRMIPAYNKLMDALETEGDLFDSCKGVYEVGKLYALKRSDDSVCRVKVVCDCPTIIEYIDDGQKSEDDTSGRKLFVDLFEKENLFKLHSKYTTDLVPFSIRVEARTKLAVRSEIVVLPKDVDRWTIWSVDIVHDDNHNNECDDWIEEVDVENHEGDDSAGTLISEYVEEANRQLVEPEQRTVVTEEVINDIIPELDIHPNVPIYVSITGFDEASIYKAIPIEKKDEYHQLIQEMQREGRRFGKLYGEFKENKFYAIDRGEYLHRVQVICIDPPSIEFLEDGQTDQFDADELLVLPEKYKRADLIPFSITFDVDPRFGPDFDVLIKPVERIHRNQWFVHLDVELDPLKTDLYCCIPDGSDREFTIEQLSENDEVRFIATFCFSNTCVSGVLVPQSIRRTISKMHQKLEKISPNPDYRPKSGDLVVVFADEITRGLVLREPTPLHPCYTVFCIDYGTVRKCTNVALIPSELAQIPAASAICTIKYAPDDEEQLIEGETYTFETNSTKEGCCAGILRRSGSSSELEVKLEKCWPPRGDIIDYIPLKTGGRVKLLPFTVSSKCFVRPSGNDFVDEWANMLEHVDVKASKNPPQEDPLKFDVVAVEYRECLWRAKVLEKERDIFRVQLMDRSEELTVRRERIRVLPEYLKMLFCTAVPVKLKNVHVNEVDKRNKELHKFFSYEYDFELVIEDGEVTLKFLPDVNYSSAYTTFATVNEYLDSLLMPFWLACLKNNLDFEAQIVKDDQMVVDPEDWPQGCTLTLHVTSVGNNGDVYVCNRNGPSYKRYVELDVDNRLQEYGRCITNSYCPAEGHVCIAQSVDGVWSRATCYEAEPGKKPKLQFWELGRCEEVHHTKVRHIPMEFVEFPVSTIQATILNGDNVDLKKLDGKECSFEITKLFLPEHIEVKLILTDDLDDSDTETNVER